MAIPLPRTTDLSEFNERYLQRGQPAVVTGALSSMAASSWTSAYLSELLGEHRPTVRLGTGRLALMNMRDFFRYLEASHAMASSHGGAYLRDFYLTPSFGDPARARAGAEIHYPLVTAKDWPEWSREHRGWNSLYAGPAGSRSSLHVDMYGTSTWLAEISGLKAWRVAAPDAISEELAFKTDPFSVAERLPCEFYETVLEPGDVIYLPPNWWHAVENKTATIAVSGNFCTLEHARSSLAEVEAMPDCSERDVWLKTWTAVIEEGAEARI